jgi:hypothetical protein
MRRRTLIPGLAFWVAVSGLLLARPGGGVPSSQFLPDDLSQREMWEEFLATAEIVGKKQMKGSEAVTEPWVLTLKKGDVTRRALWKNAQGRRGGFWEGWNYEVAAYLLDKHLGLGMVPPTVERRFNGEKGSCQLWIEDCMTLREREQKKIKMPLAKVFGWNRATYIQRFWDNLIANEDRHMNQILITPDWRMLLIDHSRTFRSSPRFTKSLLFTAKNPDGPKLMSELPRALVEKVKALDAASVMSVTNGFLAEAEVTAVILRRDLILQEIDKLIKANGEDKVLY